MFSSSFFLNLLYCSKNFLKTFHNCKTTEHRKSTTCKYFVLISLIEFLSKEMKTFARTELNLKWMPKIAGRRRSISWQCSVTADQDKNVQTQPQHPSFIGLKTHKIRRLLNRWITWIRLWEPTFFLVSLQQILPAELGSCSQLKGNRC